MQDLHSFDPYHLPQTESPEYKKLLSTLSRGGAVLEALAYCVLPFAWQRIKLFFLSLKTLCLHISVPHRCTGSPDYFGIINLMQKSHDLRTAPGQAQDTSERTHYPQHYWKRIPSPRDRGIDSSSCGSSMVWRPPAWGEGGQQDPRAPPFTSLEGSALHSACPPPQVMPLLQAPWVIYRRQRPSPHSVNGSLQDPCFHLCSRIT